MKPLFFVMGFLWFFTAMVSLIFGSFFINRKKLKVDLIEYWNQKSSASIGLYARRAALLLAWIGFLLPAIFPIPGLIAAAFFIFLT